MLSRRILLSAGAAFIVLPAIPAFAHHGWAWTRDEFFELQGVITALYIGNPHVTLDVDAAGTVWRVELAPLGPTLAAGFNEDVVAVGDNVTAIGNRSRDPDEPRMKAVRIVVGEAVYDVYPSRAQHI